jgi:phosphoribosylformimino-5-aminoimidazole carboxamide ribonucleotide (ProFAR) isomerase
MLEGTDLDWFRRLRAATRDELTAAGGITTIEEIQELRRLGIHAALGMAIYTGRLDLDELAVLNA